MCRYLIISTLQGAMAVTMIALWIHAGRDMLNRKSATMAKGPSEAHVVPTMEVGVETAKECWTSPTESASAQMPFSGTGNGVLPVSSDAPALSPQADLLAEPCDVVQAAAINCG